MITAVGGVAAPDEFLEGYLERVLRFIGFAHIETIRIEGTRTCPDSLRLSKMQAQTRMAAFFAAARRQKFVQQEEIVL